MTINSNNRTESLVKSPILSNLRDQLNLSTNDPEKSLIIRKWKQGLIQKDHTLVLSAVKEIAHSDSPYVKNTLLPLIQDSLQTTTIGNVLDIIQLEYSSKLGKDSFHEKKAAIKNKMQEMYNKGLIDNKLIFGLGIYLIGNKDPKYAAGTFLEDIKKRLYTGDKIHESFWQTVIPSTTPQKDKAQEATTENIKETLTSSN